MRRQITSDCIKGSWSWDYFENASGLAPRIFTLNNIVSTEFFDDDVGSFFLIMHGVEGEGGAVQNGHLSQESLGGGDLVGFIGGSDLG